MTSFAGQTFFETDHRVPLVDLQLYLKTGSSNDPEYLTGLSRLAWNVLLSGTEDLSRVEVPAAWDERGARLSVTVSLSYVALHLTCLRNQVDASAALLSRLLREPAHRKQDLAFHQRDMHQSRLSAREEPQALAARAFALAVFQNHPYGRGARGTEIDNARVTLADIRAHLDKHLVQGNLVMGCSGDIDAGRARSLVDREFGSLALGEVADQTPVVQVPSRTAVVVEMPEQSQAQLYIGTLGSVAGEPDYEPWRLATTIFGGVFSSRLTQEIREKHGFSYEASARLSMARQRNTWRTYCYPSFEDLADCIRVQLEMIASLREMGVTEAELTDAKKYLAHSQCFERETACKRIDPRLDEAIYGLPSGWFSSEADRLQVVTNDQIVDVLGRRLPEPQLCLGVAGPRGTARIVEQAFAPEHLMVLSPEAVAS